MKRKKLLLNLCLFSILFLIFSTSFIYFVFATKYDEDLSNLSSTNSVTLKIGDNDYTVKSDTDIDGLINLDAGILEYKAKDGTIDYTKIYNQLLEIMKKNATEVDSDINEQTISESTIWKIDSSVNMNGNVTISSTGNLIIIGNGTIKRTGSYSISNNGNLFLQDNVIADGNSQSSDIITVCSGNLYVSDNFNIGNTKSTGVKVKSGKFYMLGGMIGTQDITFYWYDENDNSIGSKNYSETLKYIDEKIESDSYDYIYGIQASGGCISSGVVVESEGVFKFYDGVISGNGNSGIVSYGKSEMLGGLIIGNYTSNWGAAIKDSSSEFKILGGKILANYTPTYGGAIDAGKNTIIEGNTVLAYNSSKYNGGAIVIGGGSKTVISGNALLTHNTAIGIMSNFNTGSGNGGCIRVVGTLIINGGTISYNYANGRKEYCPDYLNSGNGGAISGQTDEISRIADIQLNSGNIINNKAREYGGGIFITCTLSSKQATFKLNGTNISNNVSGDNGGGIYLSARIGMVVADILNGVVSGNISGKNGGGIFMELSNHLTSMAEKLVVNIGEKNNTNLILKNNKSMKNGGAIYIDRSSENVSEDNKIDVNLYGGKIQNNTAVNGGAIGITKGNFGIYGAYIENNAVSNYGGGIYQTGGNISISGGNIINNVSEKNGGGIYLASANINMNDGNVQYNTSSNGNGSGIYLSNDSKFSFLNGKVVYNTASCSTSISNMTAKESSCGVGGGVYIEKGTFSMYDESNNAGTGAIYGNIASYAADDLFATGKNTKFDAISVIEMKKSDEYMTSDSWFEDFPEGEEHMSLNKDNRVNLISKGRYKKLSNDELVDDMIAATTVLNRDCTDYIAITMGKGIGDLSLQVKDTNVQSDQIFLYKLEYVKANDNDNGDLSMIISVDSSKSSIIRKLPSGRYKLTLIPEWSWRYENKVSANIMVNNSIFKTENNSFEFNIYSNQMTKCETSYFLKKNSNVFTKFFSIIAGDS